MYFGIDEMAPDRRILMNRFNAIQVGISVPVLFTGHTSRNKAAKINVNKARTDAEYYTKELSQSYRTLLDEYGKQASSVTYYEQQAVPEADLIIAQSTREYKAGAMEYLDYILSLDRALEIRQNYLDALNSYNQTIISIEFLTGKTF